MMKWRAWLCCLSFCVGFAYAEPSATSNQQAVYELIKQYSKIIACGIDIKKDDIFAIQAEEYQQSYAVLWQGDVGCYGGNGTTSYLLSIFSRPDPEIIANRPFLLVTEDVFYEVNRADYTINSRFIESVKIIEPKVLEVVSRELAKDDYPNQPSERYRYLITYEDIAGWKKEKLLKQQKLPNPDNGE